MPRARHWVLLLAAFSGVGSGCRRRAEPRAEAEVAPPPAPAPSVKPGVSPCPSTEPSVGAPCDKKRDYAVCSYGEALAIKCRRRLRCSEQVWESFHPIPAWCAEVEAACDRAPLVSGAACATSATCVLNDGRRCHCAEGHWKCYREQNHPECPLVAPQFGSPCTKQLYCTYGPGCSSTSCFQGSYAVSGLWQPPPCAED